MTNVVGSILMGLLRYVLAGVVAWLINNGIATEEQTNELLAGLAGAIILVAWLVYVKLRDHWSILQALELKAGSSLEDLKTALQDSKARSMVWFLPLLLSASIAGMSCASWGSRIDPAEPVVVEQVQKKAIEIANAVSATGDIVIEARRVSGAAYDAGVIDLATLTGIYQVIIDLNTHAQTALDELKRVTREPSLRSLTQELVTGFVALMDRLGKGTDTMRSVADLLRKTLAVAFAYLDTSEAAYVPA